MKETTLIEMKNKVDALTRVMRQVIYDVNETKDLTRGTLEVLKKMPEYEKAVEKLKEEYEKVSKIANKAKNDKKLELDEK